MGQDDRRRRRGDQIARRDYRISDLVHEGWAAVHRRGRTRRRCGGDRVACASSGGTSRRRAGWWSRWPGWRGQLMTKKAMLTLAIACGVSVPVVVIGRQPQQSSPKGEAVFQSRCSTCHDSERATAAPRTRKAWESVLEEMVNKGAQLEAG